MAKIEHFEFSLSSAIQFYIQQVFKQKGWSIVAVDQQRDVVVVKRYELEADEKED